MLKSRRFVRFAVAAAVVVLLAGAAWATRNAWLPKITNLVAHKGAAGHGDEHGHEHGGHDHEEGHEHEHGGHVEANSIQLSDKALMNIGYKPVTVSLGDFARTVSVPAIVVEQPGKTQINVASPLTGTVSEVHIIPGEALEPGSPMFDVRVTHEEVVTLQRDFLLTSENLDIVNREIARLQSFGDGVIPGKRILEQQYEKQKLEAAILAGRQGLLLHGLSEEQIENIRKQKQLVKSMTIRAPSHKEDGNECKDGHLFHVQDLSVTTGQQVQAGQLLCVLADHCSLLIEGRAFEDDAKLLRQAAQEGWNVTGTLLVGDGDTEKVEGLKVLYLSDKIDPESRAFHFYLRLPNSIVRDQKTPDSHRFIEWHFKPGQRLELRVPFGKWKDRIVLPVDAVIDEGAENYVYRRNGNHFDRVPVHEEFKDREYVVIANDGALFPGDVVAGTGAYQIHLALKNKSGGGPDPHAGHNH